MAVRSICKLHKDLTENKWVMLGTNLGFSALKAKAEVNDNLTGIQTCHRFYACKFDKEHIKTKQSGRIRARPGFAVYTKCFN